VDQGRQESSEHISNKLFNTKGRHGSKREDQFGGGKKRGEMPLATIAKLRKNRKSSFDDNTLLANKGSRYHKKSHSCLQRRHRSHEVTGAFLEDGEWGGERDRSTTPSRRGKHQMRTSKKKPFGKNEALSAATANWRKRREVLGSTRKELRS